MVHCQTVVGARSIKTPGLSDVSAVKIDILRPNIMSKTFPLTGQILVHNCRVVTAY